MTGPSTSDHLSLFFRSSVSQYLRGRALNNLNPSGISVIAKLGCKRLWKYGSGFSLRVLEPSFVVHNCCSPTIESAQWLEHRQQPHHEQRN